MTEPRRALEGIRVLELAQVVAGDDLRRIGPSEDGHSYWFAVDNRNPAPVVATRT